MNESASLRKDRAGESGSVHRRARHPHRMRMNLELDNKLAMVTGSAAGIGFAIAETLAMEGARVIVNGRTEARVKHAVDKIKSAGAKSEVLGLAADLGTAA